MYYIPLQPPNEHVYILFLLLMKKIVTFLCEIHKILLRFDKVELFLIFWLY